MNWKLMCRNPVLGHVNVFEATKAKTLTPGHFTFEKGRCTHTRKKPISKNHMKAVMCRCTRAIIW